MGNTGDLPDPATLGPQELYPYYVAFQAELREYALATNITEQARTMARKLCTTAPFELFEARREQLSQQEKGHQARKWVAGFDVWLANKDSERRLLE